MIQRKSTSIVTKAKLVSKYKNYKEAEKHSLILLNIESRSYSIK